MNLMNTVESLQTQISIKNQEIEDLTKELTKIKQLTILSAAYEEGYAYSLAYDTGCGIELFGKTDTTTVRLEEEAKKRWGEFDPNTLHIVALKVVSVVSTIKGA